MERRHTFKSHIRTGWKLVTLERLLELLLQGGTGDFSILIVVFVPIVYLSDEVVEFREDRHNRDCVWSVTTKSLEILNYFTIQAKSLIEEHLFQSQ